MSPDHENLEQELRASLRRTAAPPGFAEKVLARAGAPLAFPKPVAGPKPERLRPRQDTILPHSRRAFTLALAAGIAVMAIIPAVVVENRRREEARGLKAKRDLLTALAITRDQLQQAREKVRRTTRNIQ